MFTFAAEKSQLVPEAVYRLHLSKMASISHDVQ